MNHRLKVETAAQVRRRRVALVVGGVLILLAAAGLYLLGRMQAVGPGANTGIVHDGAGPGREQLLERLQSLKAENHRLAAQVAELRRMAEVDQTAASQLRDSLAEMQARITELEKQLAFYRRIVSPHDAEAGLHIHNVTVKPAGEKRIYDLGVTLIQAMRYDAKVSGRVRVRMHCVRDGESVSLDWSDVKLDSAPKLVFSFEYFEHLRGLFHLPEGLDVVRVEVTVDPEGSEPDALTRTYSWQEVMAASQ